MMLLITVKIIVKKGNILMKRNNLALIAKYNIALCVMVQAINVVNVQMVINLCKTIKMVMHVRR